MDLLTVCAMPWRAAGGRTRDARALASGEHPLERWLAALFTEDAVVSNASVPQLQALSSS
jgi:hypothetical protein